MWSVTMQKKQTENTKLLRWSKTERKVDNVRVPLQRWSNEQERDQKQ